jgi:hypothetical protein
MEHVPLFLHFSWEASSRNQLGHQLVFTKKRHADWLCTPSDENDVLLSWEVILVANSGSRGPGDRPELLQHAHHVPTHPVLGNFAAHDPVDGNAQPLHRLIRRLKTHQGASVSPDGRKAGHDFVPFGDLVLDDVV